MNAKLFLMHFLIENAGKHHQISSNFLFLGQMVEFTNTVYGEPVNYVVSEGGTLGLSRGNKGFFAMGDLNREFDTGLPDGEYCDIISECQQKITVTIWFTNFPCIL